MRDQGYAALDDSDPCVFTKELSDGEIAQPELESYMSKLGFAPAAIEHVFAQLDLDADGVLSRDELAEVFLKYSALRMALRVQGPIVSLESD